MARAIARLPNGSTLGLGSIQAGHHTSIALLRLAMQKRLMLLIVLGLVAWGAFHAWGAYRLNHNPWRAVMVLACVGAFLGFWFLLLARRKARLSRPSTRHDHRMTKL
jgi:uncharacterized membrane protein YqjE